RPCKPRECAIARTQRSLARTDAPACRLPAQPVAAVGHRARPIAPRAASRIAGDPVQPGGAQGALVAGCGPGRPVLSRPDVAAVTGPTDWRSHRFKLARRLLYH